MSKGHAKIGLSEGIGAIGTGSVGRRWQLRQLASDTFVYAVTMLLVRLLTFLLTPLYTNVLQPEAFGEVSYLFALLAFANVVLALGWESAYMRFAAERQGEARRAVFAYAWGTMVVNGALLCLGVWIAAPVLAPVLQLSRLGAEGVRAAALVMLLDGVAVVPLAELRLRRRPLWYGGLRLVNAVVQVAATVLFVLVWRWGAPGVLWAGVVASASTAVGTAPVIARLFRWQWQAGLYWEMLRYGLPAVPAALASIALHVVDRPLLMLLADAQAVGIYQANYRLALPMLLMVTVFEYAWRPFFLQQAQRPDGPQLFAAVFWRWNLTAALFFVGMVLWIPVLAQMPIGGGFLIHPDYWEGLDIVPIVAAGYVLFGIYVFAAAAAHIRKRTERLAGAMILAAVTNIGLLLLLVPWLGYRGAAWATLGAYTVAALAMLLFAQRLYPVPYPWGRVGGVWGIAGIVAILGMGSPIIGRLLWSVVAVGLLWGWWRIWRGSV